MRDRERKRLYDRDMIPKPETENAEKNPATAPQSSFIYLDGR
jgi:hypothetical protein